MPFKNKTKYQVQNLQKHGIYNQGINVCFLVLFISQLFYYFDLAKIILHYLSYSLSLSKTKPLYHEDILKHLAKYYNYIL